MISVSEARLASVLATAADGIVVIDEDARILVFNAACMKMLGYQPEEVMGQNIKMLMPPEYSDHHDSFMHNYKSTGQRKIIGIGREVLAQHKDGSIIPVELSVGEATLAHGRQFIGILRDLRPRRETQRRMDDLQGQLVHMARLSAMDEMGATLAHELNQPLTAVMLYLQAVSRFLDKTAEPAPGNGAGQNGHAGEEDDAQEAENGHASSNGNGLPDSLLSNGHSAGAHNGNGNGNGHAGNGSNGRTHNGNGAHNGGGNGHDGAGQSYVTAGGVPTAERMRDILRKAVNEADRAGSIIQRLRQFVERKEVDRRQCDLRELVEEAIELASIGARARSINVNILLDDSPVPLMADPIQIQQIIINLVRNAIDAIAQHSGSRVDVTARLKGGNAHLVVSDDGPGIAPEMRERLFKAFATTKDHGLGIGLAIAQSIAQNHGGELMALDNPNGVGARFVLSLPSDVGAPSALDAASQNNEEVLASGNTHD